MSVALTPLDLLRQAVIISSEYRKWILCKDVQDFGTKPGTWTVRACWHTLYFFFFFIHPMHLLVTKSKPYNVLQCACLLPKCPLKACNVPTCYQSFSSKLTMCLLVAISFTNEWPLACLPLTVPLLVTKHSCLSTKCTLKTRYVYSC